MERRTGDTIEIDGAYQYEALHNGRAPQRFWHWAKYDEALRLLAPRRDEHILDAGCGSGVLSDGIAASGAKVLGVDGNKSAIAFARSRYSRPGLAFRDGLIDELPLEPASFDGIVLLEVIEHVTVAQAQQVLSTFFDLLRPGGRLVLSTPNRRSAWPLIEWTMDRLRLAPTMDEEQHDHLYDRHELGSIGRAAGFEIGTQTTVNTFAPWLSWVSQSLARRLHRWEVRNLRQVGSLLLFRFERPRVEALADSRG